jgi:hypothetical protein
LSDWKGIKLEIKIKEKVQKYSKHRDWTIHLWIVDHWRNKEGEF